METKFYQCPICGNVVLSVVDSGVTPHCCGQEMQVLEPTTIDGKVEAHLPAVAMKCCPTESIHCEKPEATEQKDCHKKPMDLKLIEVKIGEKPHPMTDEHSIRFIYLATKHSGQIKFLNPEHPACVHFITCGEPRAIYSYCNLHGLWKKDMAGCNKTKNC